MSDRRSPVAFTPAVVNALIGVEQEGRACWRVRRYSGSMLTFEFGEPITGIDAGGSFEVGTSGLGVRNCQWTFSRDPISISSDDLAADTASQMTMSLKGAWLTGCERRKRRLVFSFSNLAMLSLDLTNLYGVEADEAIASLNLEGGAFLELLTDGHFDLIPSASVRPKAELAA